MKNLLTTLLLFCSMSTHAQTICGTANEGGSVTLTAPPGHVFISIVFASYGTPNGSCGTFTIGGCHALGSIGIAEDALLGQNSASISATNGVFGDPCGGTPKRLYVEAVYAATLPLSLLSLSATAGTNGHVQLNWSTNDEVNTSHFIVEYSTNATQFQPLATVAAKGNGAAVYSSVQRITAKVPVVFFRLKMVDVDGSYIYSHTIAVRSATTQSLSAVSYNNQLTISSRIKQEVVLLNSNGQLLRKFLLSPGTTIVPIATFAPGIYFLKSSDAVVRFVK
jgi:hypothetical protein